MNEDHLPLVDQRVVRRFDLEEGGAVGPSGLPSGLPRQVASCTAVAGIATSCVIFLAGFATSGALALPALWAAPATHVEFAALAASLALGGSLGAAVATHELGIWGKIDQTPRWLRWLFVAGMCGFFPLVPLVVLPAALGAKAFGYARTSDACVLARQWTECGSVLQLVLSLMVQAGAAASYGLDLWLSIVVGFAALVKVAAEHDTHNHVYLWLTYREGKELGRDIAAGQAWEASTPLITGPLDSLLEPQALLVLIFRAAEVGTQLGCFALFQAGTRDWLSVSGVGIGGPLLFAVQCAAHTVVFRMSSGWMSAGYQRAFYACLFIPKPVLDSEVPVMSHYAVMAVSQAAVLGVGYSIQLPTELPRLVCEGIILGPLVMWLLLVLLRGVLAGSGRVSGGAAELSDKVRLGIVELQPLTADQAQLGQLIDFCRAFCQHFFGEGFEYDGSVLRLDLSKSNQEVRSICTALILAEPLLRAAPKLELDLEGTGLRDADIADLVELLPQTTESIEVNLAGTQVGDVGVVRLAQMLPPGLRTLEVGLNSTSVTDKGVAVLAQHLPQDLSSLEIILYNTMVGDRGLAALAGRLPPDLANLRLGLYKSLVGDEGAITLAEKLPQGLQIFRIELAGTPITDRGASALAEHLPPKLVKFEANVSGTKVSAEVKALLTEAASYPAFGGRSKAGAVTEAANPPADYCCRLVPFFSP